MPNNNNVETGSRIASGTAGALVGYLGNLSGENLTPDNCLWFLIFSGFLGGLVVDPVTPTNTREEGIIRGIASAILYEGLEQVCSPLRGTWTLFLLASVDPSVVEAGWESTSHLRTNLYSWWNRRPLAEVRQMDVEDLESQSFLPVHSR